MPEALPEIRAFWTLLLSTLRDLRRPLLGWCAGLLLYTLLVTAFYPTIRDDPGINEVLRNLPDSLRTLFGEDLTTPTGYLGGRLFSLMPLILTVFAAQTGAALIAGAEERGQLEWPLAQPVSRWTMLAARSSALLLALLLLALILFLGTGLGGAQFGLDVPPGRLWQTALLHGAAAWLFGALALGVGAASGRAGLAAALGGGLGVLLVVLHTLSPQVRVLRDLAGLNPWTAPLGGHPLTQPVGWGGPLTVVLLGLAVVVFGGVRFSRRDLGG